MRIQLDRQGNVHAVWGHTLENNPYIDPLSYEVFSLTGIFYAKRSPQGEWSISEQIGSFAPFAYSFDFDLSNVDEPVIVWQAVDGLVTRTWQGDSWTTPLLLASVVPPEEPDPYGPGRWGEATALVELGQDDQERIYAVYAAGGSGLFLSRYVDGFWDTPLKILPDTDAIETLKMAVAPDGIVHLLFFKNDELNYIKIVGDTVNQTSLRNYYDDYGTKDVDLKIDDAGFIYILSLPRTPQWAAFIPSSGIPIPTQTPTSQPPTSMPTTVLLPTLTTPPDSIPTPTPVPSEDNLQLPRAMDTRLTLFLIGITFVSLFAFSFRKPR
jgi:hypothetical protein